MYVYTVVTSTAKYFELFRGPCLIKGCKDSSDKIEMLQTVPIYERYSASKYLQRVENLDQLHIHSTDIFVVSYSDQ